MAFALFDAVKETSTTSGTGDFTLAAAAPGGFRRFADVCTVGDTLYYTIEDYDNNAREVGIGSYSGANMLTRSIVLASTNGGALVSFAVGSTKFVWLDDPAKLAKRSKVAAAVTLWSNFL